jgi:hypothetical protein
MMVNNFDDTAATKDRGKYVVLGGPPGADVAKIPALRLIAVTRPEWDP